MARIDVSRLDEGGVTKPTVNPVSKAQTSGAVSKQFTPYVTPAPTTSKDFVGPTVPKAYGANNTPAYQPATATKITNQTVSSPSPSNLPSKPVVNTPAATVKAPTTSSATATVATPNVTLKKPKPAAPGQLNIDGPSPIKLSTPVGSTATMSPNAKGSAVADFAAELTGLPAAARLITGTTQPLFGSQGLGTTVDVLSVIPGVGLVGKGLKTAGALGKVAKAEGVANAAFKGAQMAPKIAANKAVAAGAATTMALSPVVNAAEILKPVTSITQAAKVAPGVKTATKAADTFTPNAAKASKAIDNVKAPATKAKSGPSSLNPASVQSATDAAKAAGFAGVATNATNAVSKAPAAAQSATEAAAVTQASAGNRANEFTAGQSGADYTAKVDAAKYKDADSTKQADEDLTKADDGKYTNYDDNVVSTVQQVVNAATQGTSSGKETPGKANETTGKTAPKVRAVAKLPDGKEKEDMKRKRRWTPSAVV